MSIKLATQKDVHKWNEIVERDPQGNFFDRFEWCQALSLVSRRIKPLSFFVEEDGRIVGVFPSCLVKYKLSGSLESLPFSDYGGGPFFRRDDILKHTDFFMRFYNNLIELGSRNRCLKISVRRAYFPNLINQDIISKPVITDINTCTFLISLREGIDQVYRKISNSRRRSIRQAEKRGAVIHEAKDLDDLQNFYEIYVQTMKGLRSTPLPYRLFNYIWNVFIPRNEAKIFIAEYNSRPIGGILLFIYKEVCHAWAGGSLEKFEDKRPMDLLVWHSIKWAFANNLELFDFGSTNNDPSSGHYFYKKTWGAKKMTLYNYHVLLQPNKWKLYKFSNKLVNKIKNIFR